MKLYPYQQRAKDLIYSDWDFQNPKASENRSQMLWLPTGGGKTIVFNDIAKDAIVNYGAPVLIIAHRSELIQQAAKKAFKAYGIPPDIIQGNYPRRYSSNLKVGSVQTLYSRIKKRKKLGFHTPPLIVIWDEAHHMGADSWREVFHYFPNSLHLMVTATPTRKHGFTDFTNKLVQVVTVRELEDLFYESNGKMGLVPDTIIPCRIGPDFDKIKKKRSAHGYDFDNKPLNEILNTYEACEQIARCWEDEGGSLQKSIAFCIPRTKQYPEAMGTKLCEVMRNGGFDWEYIGWDTPKVKRDELNDAFAAGQLNGLSNTNLFTEGYDVPDIGATLLCRPTASMGLYLQMVGRGKRPSPETGKDFHFLFDFGQNVSRHLAPNVDRQWSLKGVPPKHGCTIVKTEEGNITTLAEAEKEAKIGVPLRYEILGSGEQFRIKSFAQSFEQIKTREKDRTFAARGALALWYKSVDYKPTFAEMRAIANIVIKRKDIRDSWATSRYNNICEALRMIDGITTPEDSRNAARYIDAKFRRRTNDEDVPLPGYIGLRDKLIAASK